MTDAALLVDELQTALGTRLSKAGVAAEGRAALSTVLTANTVLALSKERHHLATVSGKAHLTGVHASVAEEANALADRIMGKLTQAAGQAGTPLKGTKMGEVAELAGIADSAESLALRQAAAEHTLYSYTHHIPKDQVAAYAQRANVAQSEVAGLQGRAAATTTTYAPKAPKPQAIYPGYPGSLKRKRPGWPLERLERYYWGRTI